MIFYLKQCESTKARICVIAIYIITLGAAYEFGRLVGKFIQHKIVNIK